MLGVHLSCMQTEGQHSFFLKIFIRLSEAHSGMDKTNPDEQIFEGLVLKTKENSCEISRLA